MRILAVVGTALLVACAGPIHGTTVQFDTPVATATTSEPGGLRVLASATASRLRLASASNAELATTPEELVRLWSEVGLTSKVPKVDFATHVVIGASFGGGPCDVSEIAAARIDANGTLILDEAREGSGCIDLLISIARVVAVPRRLLATHFTWRLDDNTAFGFVLPPVPPIAVAPAASI